MPFFPGFDIENYPEPQMMTWLKGNTNLRWCGYYLAPAPNRPPSGWNGQYNTISGQWGVLPIYVGQQDPRTATAHYTPSSILTPGQGATDGADAVDLLINKDHFPIGTFVYLDWEYGGLDGPGSSDYLKAWISAVAASRQATPGIYCSHVAAAAIAQVIATINPKPNVRFWCWKVSNANPHPFQGDISNIPALDPVGCGFAGAQSWQREQNAIVTFPPGAPTHSLEMDFSTSSLADPGAPAGAGA